MPTSSAANSAAERIRYGRAFGACAEAYDRVRSGYPPSLIRDVWRFASRPQVQFALEVGAGSGKATTPFAELGANVECIEPSRRMSQILRAKCGALPNVKVWTTSFERWRPRRLYCLLFAAQSWHLIDPDIRLAKAALVLRPGGTLALFWNEPPQPESETIRHALYAVLGEWGIDLTGLRASSPAQNHPAFQPRSLPPLYSSPDFATARPKTYWTGYQLTLRSYVDMLGTYPEYRALSAADRQRLVRRLGSTVFARGSLGAGHHTVLHLARRTVPDGRAGKDA
jgi:SAM-dependent methyltransferase